MPGRRRPRAPRKPWRRWPTRPACPCCRWWWSRAARPQVPVSTASGPALGLLEDLRVLAPSLGGPPMIQQEPAEGPWVGLARPSATDAVGHGWTSRLALDPQGALAEGRPVALLEVDAFEELLPDAEASMGLALRWDAPSACPPQTLLLGVLQPSQRWDPRTMLALLDESRRLSKIRTLNIEQLKFDRFPLPAVYRDT